MAVTEQVVVNHIAHHVLHFLQPYVMSMTHSSQEYVIRQQSMVVQHEQQSLLQEVRLVSIPRRLNMNLMSMEHSEQELYLPCLTRDSRVLLRKLMERLPRFAKFMGMSSHEKTVEKLIWEFLHKR